MSSRKLKRKSNVVDDRPTALLIGGPFNLVNMRLNSTPDVIQVGQNVDNVQQYGKVTDPDTGAYLGCYAWLDPDDEA